MVDYAATAFTVGAFPVVTAQNASGAGATDGTPYLATFIDDIWGRFQALMDRAGIVPSGVTESVSASQHIESLKKGFALGAGYTVMYNKDADPVTNGDRVIILTGQGILRANFTELDAAVYVGDGNNTTVQAGGGAFYRADDAAGTLPNIAGIYLILPDYRGRVPRGDDIGATVDPDGAARFLGDHQDDSLQGHFHGTSQIDAQAVAGTDGTLRFKTQNDGNNAFTGNAFIAGPITDGSNGTPRISSETRSTNVQTRYAITY